MAGAIKIDATQHNNFYNVCAMSERVISTPLLKPPCKVDRFSNAGNVLAGWRFQKLITGEDGVEYHFALHSPTRGWRAYCWDKQYGTPTKIIPVAQNTVWAYTSQKHLMRLRIDLDGEASITAKTESDWLLCANENSCLVKTGMSPGIDHLRFDKYGELEFHACYDIGVTPSWAHFLPDSAIAIGSLQANKIIVLSSEGKTVYQETKQNGCCQYFGSFVVYRSSSEKGHIYYTNDPRQGWRKTDVLDAHHKRNGTCGDIIFFAVLCNACYTAIQWRENHVALYRSSSESPERMNHVWEINVSTSWLSIYEFVQHNGLLCVTTSLPILGCGNTEVPENDGFLVWDPIRDAFHTDFPRTAAIHRTLACRIPTINVPAIWGQNAYQQQER